MKISSNYEEKTSSVEPVDSKPTAAEFVVSSKGCFSAFSVGEKCAGFVPTSGSNPYHSVIQRSWEMAFFAGVLPLLIIWCLCAWGLVSAVRSLTVLGASFGAT